MDILRTAFTSARQMQRIVDDILDYSKLEANKVQLETTSFNLRELLDSVIRLMEKPAESKGLRLNLQIDPAVRLAVRGDPVRLRQVLTNLLSNAVKFTERGSVSLEHHPPRRDAHPARTALRSQRHRHRHRQGRARCSAPSARPTPPPRAFTAAPAWAW